MNTVGTVSNRDGIGAKVTVTSGGRRQWATVKTGSSYCSQSELPVTFGLGDAAVPVRVEVRWPSGRVDAVDARANETVTVPRGPGPAGEPCAPEPRGGRALAAASWVPRLRPAALPPAAAAKPLQRTPSASRCRQSPTRAPLPVP